MNYNNRKNRDEEKVFSVLMTEEEISLFSEFLEQRQFSTNLSAIDKDYLGELDKDRKRGKRFRVAAGTVSGALLGGGLAQMAKTKNPRLAAAGAIGGAALGALAGKKVGKRDDKYYDEKRKEYESADKETKAYIRHKKEKRDDRAAMMNSALVAGSIARN